MYRNGAEAQYMQYSWNYEVDFSSPTGLGNVDGTTVLGKLN